MIDLSKDCVVDKFIPKKIFYEKVRLSSSLKKEFIDNIYKIYWKYKISEETLNISKTDNIEEIEIFELVLKEKYEAKNVIKVITKEIPYPILFYIKYNEEFQYAIRYNEDVFFSEWNVEIAFTFNGLNIEVIYDNIVKKITNIGNSVKDLDIEIRKQNKILGLENEIRKLESKIRSEKQFNIKVQYNEQITKLKRKIEELRK